MIIDIKLPEKKTTATDAQGRRYGDYLWVSIYCGRVAIKLFPAHIRKIVVGDKALHAKLKEFKRIHKLRFRDKIIAAVSRFLP